MDFNIHLNRVRFIVCLLASSLSVVTGTITFSSQQQDLSRLAYINGFVYAGGEETIYKFDKDSLQVVNSAPLARSISCGAAPCMANDNDRGFVHYLSQYDDSHLILCNTLFGHCEIRKLDDLSLTKTSEAYIVTNDRKGAVVATIAPFVNDGIAQPSTWIASSYYNKEPSYAIASRQQNFSLTVNKPRVSVFNSGYSSFRPYSAQQNNDIGALKYVYAFSNDRFRFFVKRKYGKSSIAGICNNDEKFATYVEIPLECTSDTGEKKQIIQAAYSAALSTNLRNSLANTSGISAADTWLYAAFGNSNASANLSVCIFSTKQIISKIQETFVACHKENSNNDLVRIGPPELVAGASSCVRVSWHTITFQSFSRRMFRDGIFVNSFDLSDIFPQSANQLL